MCCVAIAGNFRDDAHIFPGPCNAVGHGIRYLFRPLRGIGEIIFAVGLVDIRSFCKILQVQRMYFTVDFFHVFIQACIVAFSVSPKDVGLAIVVNKHNRVNTSPTMCGSFAILARK